MVRRWRRRGRLGHRPNSATSVNADILGIGETVGILRVGMQADRVAWQRDPLQDA
jgi:imidazolonepropionase-like amidohydrolase